MPAEDSLSLLRRLTDGDSAALEELLARHLPAVRGYVRVNAGQLLRAKEASTDLVQSVCREILQNLDRFQYPSESAFRQWLFTTALRKVRNRHRYYRAEKRDAAAEVEYGEGEGAALGDLATCYGGLRSPSQELMAREEVERIEAAMDRLSEEHREVLVQAHFLGFSRAEIAQQTGRTEEAVRSLLVRARTKLARYLGES